MLSRLPLNRMFFAIFISHSLIRSPNIWLFSRSGTDQVVAPKVFELRKHPVPLDGKAHGAVALAGLAQSGWLFEIVSTAVSSVPGSDWNTALTSTSTFGMV